MASDLKIGFIGAGLVGKALAMALSARGYIVAAAASRTLASARSLAERVPGCAALPHPQDVAGTCDLVFITTPDGAIHQVASSVHWRTQQGVVHCSGASTLKVLEPARAQGASVASIHPYQTFARIRNSRDALARLQGVTFAIEGQGWLREVLEEMALALGGRAIHVWPQDRPLYHATSVMSCGYMAALLGTAARLWEPMGFSPEEGLRAMVPIARATLKNLARVGPAQATTGPLVRGDVATLRGHLEALGDHAPELVPLYCSLALQSLPVAVQRGVPQEKVEEMRTLLEEYLRSAVSAKV